MKCFRVASPVLVLALGLAGCAGALHWAPPTHTVEKGDTLYSIAFEYGLDYRELAEWNDIGGSYLIYPGQELALRPDQASEPDRVSPRDAGEPEPEAEVAEPAAGEAPQVPQRQEDLEWQWPLEGELLARFGESELDKGVQIDGSDGDPVRAAADGEVVYTGSGLIGYGKLIIIKHDNVYLSAYGHNSEIRVEEGDSVSGGDRIASVGRGRGDRPMLHFEIRMEGDAVNPLDYLPAPD